MNDLYISGLQHQHLHGIDTEKDQQQKIQQH